MFSGDTCLGPIDPQRYFDPSRYTCQIAGQVPCFSEPRVLTESTMQQTDRCSQMALVAVLDALDMARLPMDFRSEDSPVPPERVALTVATIAAGWGFLERQMHNLWTEGVAAMDRYGLTAGFLAGPQGHVSILFGIEGRARTFVSERASGANALIEGAKAIQRSDAEIAIVGGTEAPLTPLAWAAYQASNQFQSASQFVEPVHAHQPFAHQHSELLIGEGSTFLVLEEREHALCRNVPILAEIRGWSRSTDPSPLDGSRKQPGRGLTQAIHSSLAQANIQRTAVDVIFPSGPALIEEDIAEEAAIRSMFDHSLPIILPKTVLGHLQGAATATDVAVAALTLDFQAIPSAQSMPLHSDLASTGEDTNLSMRHVLVLSGGLGGTHASLIISKPE
jgi:3-oxoacyl-(acyl-carrier-protein) synthase